MSEDQVKKLNVLQRINNVMKEVSYIKKGAEIKFGNSSYTAVQHDDVTRLLHEPCTRNGLILVPNMESCTVSSEKSVNKYGKECSQYQVSVWASIDVVNMDDPTDGISSKAFAMAFDSQDKAPGKAYSMAIKYCYLKLFMLESGDDEEQRLEESHVPQNINQETLQNAAKELVPQMSPKLYSLKKQIGAKGWADGLSPEIKTYINQMKDDKISKVLKDFDGCVNAVELEKLISLA